LPIGINGLKALDSLDSKSKLLTDSYDELHDKDHGIVPPSLRVNSSLTISALAFRIAEDMVGQ